MNPFRVESFIINRKTGGGGFRPLCCPYFETTKKAIYHAKEMVKDRLPPPIPSCDAPGGPNIQWWNTIVWVTEFVSEMAFIWSLEKS